MVVTITGKDSKGNPKEFEAGFKFNYYAIEYFTKMKGATTNMIAYTLSVMFSGYKAWCYVKQVDEYLTLEDFSNYLDSFSNDELIQANIKQITKEFAECQVMQDAVLKKNAGAQKNKQIAA